MMKIRAFFLVLCIGFIGYAEELEMLMPESNKDTETKLNLPEEPPKGKIQINKNLSIDANVYMLEGYSEMELETERGSSNEFESPMTRYGAGLGLNYSIQPNKGTKLEFFVSSGLEMNIQRKGGKVKAYDTVQRYEENAYNYGERSIYTGLANSIGMIIRIANSHRLTLMFKQTQSSLEALGELINPQGIPMLNNIATSKFASNTGPYALTTQVFLTYTYVF